MKKSTLKFDNISFPLFGLLNKPNQIVYSREKIIIINDDKSLSTVDDKTVKGDYFSRLVRIKSRIHFNTTCNSIQDIIFSGTQWGMDSNAIPHDFSNKIRVPLEYRMVDRFENNLVWIKNISYPFIIKLPEDIKIKDIVYAKIIQVNNEWFIKDFEYDKEVGSTMLI